MYEFEIREGTRIEWRWRSRTIDVVRITTHSYGRRRNAMPVAMDGKPWKQCR
jgi:hypothetical protein